MNFKILIDAERCKGCAYCSSACLHTVLGMSRKLNSKGHHFPDVINPDACTGCKRCTSMCPDTAISISRKIPRETDR